MVVGATGVLANDSDPENDSLSVILVSGAGKGTLVLNSNGSFTYDPDPNFFGNDSFAYKANDGLADSNTATVSITVSPVNDPPVANDDNYSATGDTQLVVGTPGVLFNDSDPENDSLSVILVSGAVEGTVVLNPNGSFTYDPDPNVFGNDSFTYKANDGLADSNTATVSITVSPPSVSDEMHVHDLEAVSVKLGKGKWKSIVTIEVHTSGGQPVKGAIVFGTFTQNGVSLGSLSCPTGTNGTCFIDSGAFPKKSGKGTSFTVDSITHGSLTYASSGNHDSDGDSNGTTIQLSK